MPWRFGVSKGILKRLLFVIFSIMISKIVSIAVGASMLGGAAFFPVVAFAENATSTQNAEIIENLKRQIEELKAKKKQIEEQAKKLQESRKEAAKGVREAAKLLKSQLRRGMGGDEVRDLQEFLAEDRDVYPEGLITGFFGPMTENAVRKFQRKHGIDAVGEIGPKTRARIHELLEEWRESGKKIPPGLLKQLGWLGTSTLATTTASTTRIKEEFKVTLCHKSGQANETISVALPALVAHILHGDRVGACSPGSSTPPTTPDTTAPVISSVEAENISSTSVKIEWKTNEASESKGWYSTLTPVWTASSTPAASAVAMPGSSVLVTSHEIILSGLTASTTYYYVVISTDAATNWSVSSERSFTTLP